MDKGKWRQNGQHGWPILWVVGNPLGWENLRGGWCHNLAKQLSQYLYFFSFFFF